MIPSIPQSAVRNPHSAGSDIGRISKTRKTVSAHAQYTLETVLRKNVPSPVQLRQFRNPGLSTLNFQPATPFCAPRLIVLEQL